MPGVGERVDIAIAFALEHQELCNEVNKDTNRPDQVLYSDNYMDSYIVAIVHTSLVETPIVGQKSHTEMNLVLRT